MAEHHSVPTVGGTVHVVCTDRTDGDFAFRDPDPDLVARRRAIVDRPWVEIHQVHGAAVVDADRLRADTVAGSAGGTGLTGGEADAVVTTGDTTAVAVLTADCAPVVLVGDTGVGIAHAGWRGLVAGVVEATAEELRRRGVRPVTAVLGPCISAAAYEFGEDDLALVADVFGDDVRSTTAEGRPALDVPAAVTAACRRAGWVVPSATGACTSGAAWFSHRTRGDVERQATVAWIERGEGGGGAS